MKMPAPKVTAKDSEVTFELEASPDALAGLYKGVQCEISLSIDGQTVHQHTGSGILRVDAGRTAEAGQ
jgi:hypothetical protein